jgi:ribosome-binding protein aMBF1 (putative translation factor)
MIDVQTLHQKWLQDPEYKAEYDALEDEFALAAQLIHARSARGLTQAQVAQRMGSRQSVIARLEASKGLPNIKTLHRYAQAVGYKLNIGLSPA